MNNMTIRIPNETNWLAVDDTYPATKHSTMARMNPKGALAGDKPRLIDEWQKAPDIWNQVKDDLDFHYEFGKYILTGSSTPADKTEVHHSGVGRITPVKMRPSLVVTAALTLKFE